MTDAQATALALLTFWVVLSSVFQIGQLWIDRA